MRIANRYEILEKIGAGGMGIVYRARDRLTQEIVALKHVTVSSSRDGIQNTDTHLALVQEFKVLASLRHPNIISVLDYGLDERQTPFITMTLLQDAINFKQATVGKSFDFQIACLLELLLAMDYLHRRGILHRDLKPENVVVIDGHIKVLDFGLAEVGTIVEGHAGTLAYMAPEILVSGLATKQSDLYAIGVMAYEIIANQLPYDPMDIAIRIQDFLDLAAIDSHPLEFVITRLLSLNPDDRYSSATDVIHSICDLTGTAIPNETLELRESYLQTAAFVGRETELEQLELALDEMVRGKGSAWLIGGESGIGKTRLLDELRIRALVAGAIVLRGQATSINSLPYQLWRDILPRLLLNTEIEQQEAAILKELVPDIENILGFQVKSVTPLEGQAHQQRLLLTISNVLRRQTASLLIVFEDLQWLAESLVVLKHILKFIEEQPWLIVASFRNDERPELLDELSSMHYMELKRLDEEDIMELSKNMLGEVGSQAEVVELLSRETEGNAFFMVEVVRALAEAAGSLSNIGQMTLPAKVFAGGIQQIIDRRLSQMPPHLQNLMKLAAIIGREVNLNVLSATSVSVSLIDEWLNIAAQVAILNVEDNHYYFAHDKLREAILNQLDIQERPGLYRRVAEAIEKVYPNDDNYAQLLVEYWQIAGDLEKELHYTLIAAKQLVVQVGNYQQAIELLQNTLAKIENTPIPNSDIYQSEFLYFLGQAYTSISNIPQAIETYQKGLLVTDADVKTTVRLHAGICLSHWFVEQYQEAKTHIEEALQLARQIAYKDGIALSLDLLGRIAYGQGDFDTALTFYEQSLEISQEINDRLRTSENLSNIGTIFFRQGNFNVARDYLEKALQILREDNLFEGLSNALSTLGIVARGTGDYPLALEYLEESLRIRRDSGDKQGVAVSLNNLAAVYNLMGKYEIAQNYFKESLALFYEVGHQRNAAYVLKNLGEVAYANKDYPLAHDYHIQSLELRRSIADQWGITFSLGYIARTYSALQQVEKAKESLIEGLKIGQQLNKESCILHLLISAAHLVLHQNQVETAISWLSFVLDNETLPAPERSETETLLSELKNIVAESVFEAALERGRMLDVETTIAYLLEFFLKDDFAA